MSRRSGNFFPIFLRFLYFLVLAVSAGCFITSRDRKSFSVLCHQAGSDYQSGFVAFVHAIAV